MREIKFRAWDKMNSIFIYFTVKLGEETFLDSTIYGEELYLHTGLKDKNGREIYEGDIVKTDYGENRDIKGKVEFWEGHYRLYNPDITRGITGIMYSHLNSHWEVIGNIWENPELLGS